VIAAACRDSECVRFGYRRRDGTASRREVEPHSLVNHGRRWYLVAWDVHRADWRTFRVDRLTGPGSTGRRFVPRRLPAPDAGAYVKRSITGAPNRFDAVVILHTGAGELAGRSPGFWGSVEPIDANTCEYRTGGDDLDWLALRIAMLGVEFEVREPPELVEHLRALASRLTRAVG